MKNDRKTAGAEAPSDTFPRAYLAWTEALSQHRAAKAAADEAAEAIKTLPEDERIKLEAVSEQTGVNTSDEALCESLNHANKCFDEMIRVEAPTAFALFQKLEAISQVPWANPADEAGYYLDRLMADAGTLSLQPAHAWIDRWRALGGTFGVIQRNNEPARPTRGMLVALEHWEPTDRSHPTLKPHTWLVDEKDHAGAVRVLEGLLDLQPGLEQAVFAVVGPTVPGLGEK